MVWNVAVKSMPPCVAYMLTWGGGTARRRVEKVMLAARATSEYCLPSECTVDEVMNPMAPAAGARARSTRSGVGCSAPARRRE